MHVYVKGWAIIICREVGGKSRGPQYFVRVVPENDENIPHCFLGELIMFSFRNLINYKC